MPVTVTEMVDNATYGETDNGLTATRKFRVVGASSRTDAIGQSGIPAMGSSFGSNSKLVVTSRIASMEPLDISIFYVTVTYGKQKGYGTSGTTKPWDEQPRIKFSMVQYTEAARLAYSKKDPNTGVWSTSVAPPAVPILNSHNDEFDPPVMVEKTKLVIHITKNKKFSTASSLTTELKLHSSVNSTQITVAGITLDPYMGKIISLDSERKFYTDSQEYFEMNYQIEVDWNLHTAKILDAGWYYYPAGGGGGGQNVLFADAQGNPFVIPGKLDGSGHALAVGGTPVYLEFLINEPKDWAVLDLPSTVT